MNSTNQLTLLPSYMRKFSCIGSDCEDSCCFGWHIPIDKTTYDKYIRLDDLELLPLIHEHIKQEATPTPVHHATLQVTDAKCPLLTEQGLCTFQLRYGEAYLSDACAIYPRQFLQVNGVTEMAASLSCPETARLALLNPEGIEFDEITSPSDARIYYRAVIDTHTASVQSQEHHFWELRIFTIQVLQDRRYSVDDRLTILGLFYEQVQNLLTQKRMDSLTHLIQQFTELLHDASLQRSLSSFVPQTASQLLLLQPLAEVRLQLTKPSYQEALQEFSTSRFLIGDLVQSYQDAYRQYYQPFLREHEYILENYLVNQVFKNAFPLGEHGPFGEYALLVIQYAMIRMELISMSKLRIGLTTDLAIDVIRNYVKEVEHAPIFLSTLFDILQKNNWITTAKLFMLLKQHP